MEVSIQKDGHVFLMQREDGSIGKSTIVVHSGAEGSITVLTYELDGQLWTRLFRLLLL